MAKASLHQAAKAFAEYLSNKTVLIADTHGSSRAGLAKIMISLGAKTQSVKLAQNFQAAVEMMEQFNPHVVVCDYDLDNRCGLDLLQEQRKSHTESKNCLFVLVTGNTSQSAVAQAAEEDVDTFILKPYTMDQLRISLLKAAIAKLNPSNYFKTIEEGKKLLFDGKPNEALEVFKKAITLDTKPSLACFYHGQAEMILKALDAAQGSYSRGLEYNKIHYKCMVGLFELLMERKFFKDAYELVKRISRYFPANPQRLSSVLRLAVMTQSYDDIERYYQVFIDLDERNEELIKYICAALVICGKFYLQRSLSSRATELFQKAAVTASGNTRILREIVMALIQYELSKEAEEFLKRFPSQTHTGQDFISSEFVVNDSILAPSVVIEQGRKIIKDGLHDSLIYKLLIKRSNQVGLRDYSETLMQDAIKRWPDQKNEFAKYATQGAGLSKKKSA